jgi:hypothetical protein
MAKRPRAPARRGCATQSARRLRKTAKKAATKIAIKPKNKTAGKTTRKSAAAQTKQPRLSRRRTYTPEFLAYARHRFEQTEDSLVDIGLAIGASKETVRQLAEREGWIRYVRPPQGLPATVKLLMQSKAPDVQLQELADSSAQSEGEGGVPPLADTVARLQRAVLDELAAIEALRMQLRGAGSFARTARTLATLTETLQKLRRLQPSLANTGPDDADMPADIDEFRNELARRIDRFVVERTNAGDDRGAVAPPVDAAV